MHRMSAVSLVPARGAAVAGVFRNSDRTNRDARARRGRAASQARAARGTNPGDEARELRGGVELVMRFEQGAERFSGTVRNTTNQTVRDVRVEIHLSNGVELGPTPRVDLGAGETGPVELDARGQAFDWWTVHVDAGVGWELGREAPGRAATATAPPGEAGRGTVLRARQAAPIRAMRRGEGTTVGVGQ